MGLDFLGLENLLRLETSLGLQNFIRVSRVIRLFQIKYENKKKGKLLRVKNFDRKF